MANNGPFQIDNPPIYAPLAELFRRPIRQHSQPYLRAPFLDYPRVPVPPNALKCKRKPQD